MAAVPTGSGEEAPYGRYPGAPPIIDPTKLTTDAVQGATEAMRRELRSTKDLLTLKSTSEVALLQALRNADHSLLEERDRRYSEVNIEKEKALKIKETADLAALSLAREIQDYKDEKANQLREQIASERGQYATRDDLAGAVRELQATIKPLVQGDYQRTGHSGGISQIGAVAAVAVPSLLTIITLIVIILLHKPA